MDLSDRWLFVSRPASLERSHAERVVWHPPELKDPLVVSVPEVFLP